MKRARLADRGVVRVAGQEARRFLNGLVTADMSRMPSRACFAALLTPQGKIIVDFIAAETERGFLLDCPRALAATLVERLTFYRLRAKIAIEEVSESLAVEALWDAGSGETDACHGDPRLSDLGLRCIVPLAQAAADTDAAEYEAHRIALGVPQGGADFAYGDAFPHEADMDQLNGVDFAKGCFIGQEVVSRMEHRGLARTRVVPVAIDGAAPASGTALTAAGRPVGTMGSAARGRGLAALRLDRVEEALAQGAPLVAAAATLRLVKPAWARFAFPGEAKAAE
jgi:folate-binding protein YgfZ